jgi:hypothetical protein
MTINFCSLELNAVGKNIAEGNEESLLRGLLPAIAYAPNGSLIAIGQQLPRRKLQICFIELNGLRHGDFDVHCPPLPEGSSSWTIVSLEWDLSSSLLAVTLRAKEQEVLQFYTRNNYHWYLKLELPGLSLLSFDREVASRLHLTKAVTGRLLLIVADLVWDVCVSGTKTCCSAMVDGRELLLTPLALACIPPPMSKYKVSLSAPCTALSFWSPHDASCDCSLAALTSDNTVSIYRCDDLGCPKLLNHIALNQVTGIHPCIFRSVIGVDYEEGIFVVLLASGILETGDVEDRLLCLQLRAQGELLSARWRSLPGTVSRLCSVPTSSDNSDVYIAAGLHSEDACFEIWRVNLSLFSQEACLSRACTFPEPCSFLTFVSDDDGTEGPVVVGLSSKNRLFCGDALVYAGVSTFAFNRGLRTLLYVTVGTKPQLRFLPAVRLSQD